MTDEVVLIRTELVNSDMQSVQYTLRNLMLSDPFDVFFCAANNSVGLRERNFTLVVQGEWALIGAQTLHMSGFGCQDQGGSYGSCSGLGYLVVLKF